MTTNFIQDTMIRPAVAAALVLLIPLIGTLVSDDMDWSAFDFVVLGALVFGVVFAYELITKKASGSARLIAGGVLAVLFLLTWVELAVGLFGTPVAGD